MLFQPTSQSLPGLSSCQKPRADLAMTGIDPPYHTHLYHFAWAQHFLYPCCAILAEPYACMLSKIFVCAVQECGCGCVHSSSSCQSQKLSLCRPETDAHGGILPKSGPSFQGSVGTLYWLLAVFRASKSASAKCSICQDRIGYLLKRAPGLM